jgi:hypothetical protein
VKSIACTITRADGSSQTATLGSNKGDQVALSGTQNTPGVLRGAADRVQVSVTMNNGQTYKIVDVMRT